MRHFAFFVLSLFAVASLADAPRPASNNAKILFNNDGTATLELPFFNASHFLSLNSNLDGVCKLFGLGQHIPNSLIEDTLRAQVVANVDVNGRFSKYELLPGRIASLLCDTSGLTFAYVSKKEYADNTAFQDLTVSNGAFYRPISRDSSLNFICKQFGFNRYNSFKSSDTKMISLVTDKAGRGVDLHLHFPLTEIYCRND